MYNNCEFIGRLGADPESHTSQKGTSFTTFSLAVDDPFKPDAKPLWVNVIAFSKTGENAALYLHKGSLTLVQGSVELSEYEGKDGKNHNSLKLVANRLVFLSGKKEGQASGAAASTASTTTTNAMSDSDIPF